MTCAVQLQALHSQTKMKSSRIIRHASRQLSAQAAVRAEPASQSSLHAPQVTQLPSGIVVASVENNSPITRIGVAYKAGSRYESGSALGTSHCIRSAIGLGTKKCTGFGLTRNVNQIGGNIGCTTTRDHLIYSLECKRDATDIGVEFLADVSSQQAFKSWELRDFQKQLLIDLAVLEHDPMMMVTELVHKAAFRNTLGNSVYAPHFMVGKFSTEMLQEFSAANMTTGRMAVVGTGIEHSDLLNYVKQFQPTFGSGQEDVAAKYHGGDQRVENGSDLVYACVAAEGAALNTVDQLALGVVQMALGTGPHVKYGSDTVSSRLGRAFASATNSPGVASCYNVSHSDSGLFGVSVIGQSADMRAILKATVAQIREVAKSGLSEQEIKRGKQMLKAAILMDMESSTSQFDDAVVQTVTKGRIVPTSDTVAALDGLSSGDINIAAKKSFKGKLSLAAIGNLSNTPYADEL